MPFFILSIILQVVFVIHILKTGRNTTWIWIVVMLPLAGSIAYFFIEILPELMSGRTGRKVRRGVKTALNPNRDIKVAERDFSVVETVGNTANLAHECLLKGRFAEAKSLYEKCLSGMYEHDPDYLYGLAQAEFGLGDFGAAKASLDRLIANNPDYKNADAHLLYARSVEGLGEVDLAREEYATLADYYPGAEANYRYALFLESQGEREAALDSLEKILHASRTAGSHYNRMNKHWVNEAKSARKRIDS